MPAKSKKQRNAEQARRQHDVRKNARTVRRPSRDDIARLWLWQVITDAQKGGEQGKVLIAKMADKIVTGLERQGFDDYESYDVFDGLVRKYSDGLYPFRPKRHLGAGPGGPAGDMRHHGRAILSFPECCIKRSALPGREPFVADK
jgi:hypothetical protein